MAPFGAMAPASVCLWLWLLPALRVAAASEAKTESAASLPRCDSTQVHGAWVEDRFYLNASGQGEHPSARSRCRYELIEGKAIKTCLMGHDMIFVGDSTMRMLFGSYLYEALYGGRRRTDGMQMANILSSERAGGSEINWMTPSAEGKAVGGLPEPVSRQCLSQYLRLIKQGDTHAHVFMEVCRAQRLHFCHSKGGMRACFYWLAKRGKPGNTGHVDHDTNLEEILEAEVCKSPGGTSRVVVLNNGLHQSDKASECQCGDCEGSYRRTIQGLIQTVQDVRQRCKVAASTHFVWLYTNSLPKQHKREFLSDNWVARLNLLAHQEMCRAGILVVRSDHLLSSSSMWRIPGVDEHFAPLTRDRLQLILNAACLPGAGQFDLMDASRNQCPDAGPERMSETVRNCRKASETGSSEMTPTPAPTPAPTEEGGGGRLVSAAPSPRPPLFGLGGYLWVLCMVLRWM